MKPVLKKVDTSSLSPRPERNDKDIEILKKVDVLIGFSGKMYIPELEHLKEEGFEMVQPFSIIEGGTAQEVKAYWDAKGEIEFL